eukprot:4219330-Pyramimonas_sp.AAC.1
MGEQLPENNNYFTMDEPTETLKALAVGTAAGHDGECWENDPASWRIAAVVLLFMRGDAQFTRNLP